jgi:hypothetical protein
VAIGAMAQSDSAFKFSGFGTLGVLHSSEKNADFTGILGQPNGAGFTHSVDFGSDSKLGVQLDTRFSESFSAVVQVISEHRYDNTYTPYLNLAFLKYQVTPDLTLRAGRVPYSAYLISDYLKVGFAQPWVRPPSEVYQVNPVTHLDGGDLRWQHSFGSVVLSANAFTGSDSEKIAAYGEEGKLSVKNSLGASISAHQGSATYRVFYLQTKLSLDVPALDGPTGPFALLRTLPAAYGGNPALADQYQIKDKQTTYLSVGFSYDPGDWFLMTEVTKLAGELDMSPGTTFGYLTGGTRLEAWTPYLTIAKKKVDGTTSNVNPIINAILQGSISDQSSVSAGLRWDFRKNMDLKVQLDRITNGANSSGLLVNPQPAFKKGESYNLISASLDFVF